MYDYWLGKSPGLHMITCLQALGWFFMHLPYQEQDILASAERVNLLLQIKK